MSSRTSDIVDPWRLAGSGECLEGSVKLSELQGVADALGESQDAQVDYRLEFSRDSHRRPRIAGRVECALELQCQRCLEPFTYPVDARLDVTVLEVDAEAQRLDDQTDPLLAEDGRISLLKLIDEELLLALPQILRHPGNCATEWDSGSVSDEVTGSPVGDGEAANSPFAVLSQLGSKKQSKT